MATARPSDVDAEVAGDAREAGGVALADGAELPLRPVAVELAEDHGGLGGGVLGQVVAGDLGPAGGVDHPDEGVAHLAEALRAAVGVVDADREDDLVDLGGHAGQVELDLLVVALALTGEVVAGVLDGAVGAGQVVEEDEVLVREDLAVGAHADRGGVQVEVGAGGRTHVPAQAHDDVRETRSLLREADVPTLGQADAHVLLHICRGGLVPPGSSWSGPSISALPGLSVKSDQRWYARRTQRIRPPVGFRIARVKTA